MQTTMRKMGIVFIVLQDLLVGNVRNFLQGIEYSAIKYTNLGTILPVCIFSETWQEV